MGPLLEVKSGVLHTYDGQELEVHGGAYLSPEAILTTHAEFERLRHREPASSAAVPIILGVALVGLAAGFWLGRRGADDD